MGHYSYSSASAVIFELCGRCRATSYACCFRLLLTIFCPGAAWRVCFHRRGYSYRAGRCIPNQIQKGGCTLFHRRN